MRRSLSLLTLALCGCAPVLVNGNFPNPARSTDKLTATQTYEIGPYKENHQYELTLQDWTASSIGLGIKLTELDRCADPKAYSYTLVDDKGAVGTLRLADDAKTVEQKGRAGQTVRVTTQTGVFPVAITSATTAVTVQMRPLQKGTTCPSIDYKFTLQ